MCVLEAMLKQAVKRLKRVVKTDENNSCSRMLLEQGHLWLE